MSFGEKLVCIRSTFYFTYEALFTIFVIGYINKETFLINAGCQQLFNSQQNLRKSKTTLIASHHYHFALWCIVLDIKLYSII